MRIIIKTIIFLLITNFVLAQTNNQPNNELQPKSEPLELPNFIIQGNLKVDVASGAKQDPKKPSPLRSNILDSINSLDKQPSILVSSFELIPLSLKRIPVDAYLGFDIGRFTTGDVYGAYQTKIGGYDLAFKGDYNFGSGHIENSEFGKLSLFASSDFIAPTKFFIFGGSRTRTVLDYKNYNYKLYSNSLNPFDRKVNHFKAIMEVDGNYADVQFATGIGFNGFQIKTAQLETADNNFNAYLKMKKRWDKFLVGGNAQLDIHTLAGNSSNFVQLGGEMSLIAGDLSLGVEAGLQIAGTPNGDDRGGLLLKGIVEYRMNKFFTIKGDIRSGLSHQTYIDSYYNNPYISNYSNFDFTYDIINLNGIIEFHPYQELTVSALFNFSHQDRIAVFVNDEIMQIGSFLMSYQTGTKIKSVFEMNWNIKDVGTVVSNITAQQTSLSDFSSSSIPYFPNIYVSTEFNKQWSDKFGTKIGFDYVGDRFADLENKVMLDPYLNIKIGANYFIMNNLKLFVNFENLLNSDIYIWNAYKERGIFASIGARYNL